ncbi:MAG: response regulator transcription factor [Anaerolineae bacterium]|jgi:DNA-binding response OmpR family regulator|nr:response regulator transcription factor [Anaerolineae bacterium]MBT7072669.1 response regulator transcription factor [Anaerolineae bacterium]MBT7326850.1 response regulator transcription factor [Anaerolineae bacterium]
MLSSKTIDATVLIIEGKHADFPSFTIPLQKKGFDVRVAKSGSQASALLKEVNPDVLVVNAASMRSSGIRICKTLREQDAELPIILIVAPEKEIDDNVATVILHHSFTVQKLANRIKPLLPGEGENLLQVGSIRLDLDRNRVRCLGQNTRLTPRLVTLLEALLKRPGEVVEREELFKKVWDTDYTGDTRTLDVHISWLRRAIEPDPTKPKFLRTIRGVGYRLDV